MKQLTPLQKAMARKDALKIAEAADLASNYALNFSESQQYREAAAVLEGLAERLFNEGTSHLPMGE